MFNEDVTCIIQNGINLKELQGCYSIKDAINEARLASINGRIEIHRFITNHYGAKVLYSLHFINEENRIIGGIFPETCRELPP